jgi:hypothetical protein
LEAGTCPLAPSLAGLLNSLPPNICAAGRDPMVNAYIEALREADIGIQNGYLQERIDSRRVLMAARDLPAMCRTYLQRKDMPEYRQWCRWFLDRAGKDVAELHQLLGQIQGG